MRASAPTIAISSGWSTPWTPAWRNARRGSSDYSADLWRELGPGLVLLLLPFAALAFRRGLIWLLPLWIMVLPPDAQALDWQSLWRNDDQRALQLFEQEQHEAAAQLFADDEWQATAKYRAGDFAAAEQDWQQLDGESARYNHANALAQQERYEEALAAYDRLLEQNSTHEDARFNKPGNRGLARATAAVAAISTRRSAVIARRRGARAAAGRLATLAVGRVASIERERPG